MDKNAQINISFPNPGEWNVFRLTALWDDEEGFSCRRPYRPDDLTGEQVEVLTAAIGNVVGLGAPWAASHAVVHLESVAPTAEQTFAPYEVLELDVYAKRDSDGATRHFTSKDLPVLRTEDARAIELFKTLVS